MNLQSGKSKLGNDMSSAPPGRSTVYSRLGEPYQVVREGRNTDEDSDTDIKSYHVSVPKLLGPYDETVLPFVFYRAKKEWCVVL